LLGSVLRAGDGDAEVALRITEVEAYAGVGQDPASHAFRGPTRRNASMFGRPGLLYVYFTYGMHWCVNVVCHPEGSAGAVLIRAGQVVRGVPLARERRANARRDSDLARGPARLARALGLDGGYDGLDLLDPGSPVLLEGPVGPPDPARVASGPRVGVRAAESLLWRFWIPGEPSVSVYRPGRAPRRRRGSGR
jgi:DNA-3-methyladenine glycosylase